MMRRVFSFLLILLFSISVLSTFYTAQVYAEEKAGAVDIEVQTRIEKRLSLLKSSRYIDESLETIFRPTRVIAVFNGPPETGIIKEHFVNARMLPQIGDLTIVVGTLKPGYHGDLIRDRMLITMFRDMPVNVPMEMADIFLGKLEVNSLLSKLRSYKSEALASYIDLLERSVDTPDFEMDSRNIPIDDSLTMRDVDVLIGAEDVWSTYGITGEGITVAVVDTGVDYGSLGLGYWDSVARDSNGVVAAFDSDALGLVFTDIVVTAYESGGSVFVNTSGTDPVIYLFGSLLLFSMVNGTTFNADMEVTGILNPGEQAHFGLMFQYLLGLDLFPVLVVDSDRDGVYDTVYVDISFDWYWMGLGEGSPDFSFTDETPLRADGWSIGGRDFDGDGLYDLSISSLGYGLDVYGVAPNIFDRGSVLKPIDPYGNYTVFVYDWHGHGTAVSNVIGGRFVSHPLYYTGVAPDVKILGIPALFIGDIIEGWLWAAGFDLIPGTEGWVYVPGYGWVYGSWTYTGEHKADIISNSWGWSSWAYYFAYYGLPWYDILTILEDALTVPGYLDPDYPGTVMVHAAGNGAPGYGTVTEPGYNTLAITVGASTSLNSIALYTQLLYGNNGYLYGYGDQVVSWSARGPNAYGVVKPEIMAVGAFGWTAGPVWYGFGDGFYTYTLFGGTSMATPVVSGVVSLVLSAAKSRYLTLTPEDVKVILKSTAKDLGYDALTQGSGRVDAFAAVSTVMDGGVTLSTDATYRNLYQKLWMDPWLFAYFYSSGYELDIVPPAPAIYDTSWFAGDLLPGESSFAQFRVKNTMDSGVEIEFSAVRYELIDEVSMTFTTEVYEWLGYYYLGKLIPIDKDSIPADTDLMVISSNISVMTFDSDLNYTANNEIFIYVFDWYDWNGDGIPQSNESIYVGYSAADGTTEEVKIGKPLETFQYTPLIRVRQYFVEGPIEPVNVTVKISYLRRVPWTWITFSDSTLSVGAGALGTFTAFLNVPEDAPMGLYHGFILANINGLNRVVSIPVTVNVYKTVSAEGLSEDLELENIDPLYSPDEVKGYFDWGWRAEAGDWRLWFIRLLDAPSLIGTFAVADWVSNYTDIDMMSFDRYGWMLDGSTYTRIGGGIFLWETRTGTSMEYVSLWPESGYYSVLLHNVLLDGRIYPEKVSGEVRFTHLFEHGLTETEVEENNIIVKKKFRIETGLSLSNVNFTLYYAPENISVGLPALIEGIDEFSSEVFEVQITVPMDIANQVYDIYILITADEFPYAILLIMSIDVRPTLFPLTAQGISNVGFVVLNLPTEEGGTLTLFELGQTFNLTVVDIIEGDHLTYVFLEMNYNVGGVDNWISATLIIDRDNAVAIFYSEPVYFVGYYY